MGLEVCVKQEPGVMFTSYIQKLCTRLGGAQAGGGAWLHVWLHSHTQADAFLVCAVGSNYIIGIGLLVGQHLLVMHNMTQNLQTRACVVHIALFITMIIKYR